MPISDKTYGNMEIIQGSDFEIEVVMDDTHVWNNKKYRVTIVKDFDNTTFDGSIQSNGANTGKLAFGDASVHATTGVVTNVDTADVGAITITPSTSTTANGVTTRTGGQITIKVDREKTKLLSDDFEGYWDVLEATPLTAPTEFTRQGQGEVYINAMATSPGDFA